MIVVEFPIRMSGHDTSIGAGQDFFPETPWSSVLRERNTNSPKRQERLTELCRLYWRPVYKFTRAQWSKSVEDAKDLTQSFFVHILDSDFMLNFKPEAGRFRTFLKGALKHFLSNANRDAGRQKRGGGRAVVSIDAVQVETSSFLADLDQYSPEEIFDRQWARDLLRMTVDRLRELLEAEGKPKYFAVYEAYELFTGGERPTYRAIAGSVGVSTDDVKNYLTYARARFRDLLLESVTGSVSSRDELMQEISELFSD